MLHRDVHGQDGRRAPGICEACRTPGRRPAAAALRRARARSGGSEFDRAAIDGLLASEFEKQRTDLRRGNNDTESMACAAGVLAGLLSGAPAIARPISQDGEDHRSTRRGRGPTWRPLLREQLSSRWARHSMSTTSRRRRQIGARTAHAPLDGYTLMMGTTPPEHERVLYLLWATTGEGLRADHPGWHAADGDLSNPSFPANSVADWSQPPRPSDKIDMALPATAPHVFELLKDRTGAQLSGFYKGSATA